MVLKSYPEPSRDSYNREVLYFSRSEECGQRAENIVRCFGHYSCTSSLGDTTYNLLLEYAARGSLLDYYNSERHPSSEIQRKGFWSSLLPFLCGLEHMHSTAFAGSGTSRYVKEIAETDLSLTT